MLKCAISSRIIISPLKAFFMATLFVLVAKDVKASFKNISFFCRCFVVFCLDVKLGTLSNNG